MLYNACLIAEYFCYIKKDYDLFIVCFVQPQNFRSVFYFAVLKIQVAMQKFGAKPLLKTNY